MGVRHLYALHRSLPQSLQPRYMCTCLATEATPMTCCTVHSWEFVSTVTQVALKFSIAIIYIIIVITIDNGVYHISRTWL